MSARLTRRTDAALLEAERLLKQKRSSDEGGRGCPPQDIAGCREDEPQRQRRRDLRRGPLRHRRSVGCATARPARAALEQQCLARERNRVENLRARSRPAADGSRCRHGDTSTVWRSVLPTYVPSGPVGIVSAAGTGLQEVSTLLAKHGVGITQGLGTGGRDLKAGGRRPHHVEGLKALQADPATKVIALVSKPPSPAVAEAILDQVAQSDKPAIIGFMGANPAKFRSVPNALPASTLQELRYLQPRRRARISMSPRSSRAKKRCCRHKRKNCVRPCSPI